MYTGGHATPPPGGGIPLFDFVRTRREECHACTFAQPIVALRERAGTAALKEPPGRPKDP